MERSSWRRWAEKYCILPVGIACGLLVYLQYNFAWFDSTVPTIIVNVMVATSLLGLIMAIASLPTIRSWIALVLFAVVWYFLGFEPVWAII
jgi:hypothetical protein